MSSLDDVISFKILLIVFTTNILWIPIFFLKTGPVNLYLIGTLTRLKLTRIGKKYFQIEEINATFT